MNNQTDNEINTKFAALLGLAASKTTTDEPCPSDQQLTDFIEGSLNRKVQRQVLTHLNSCPDCREVWLDASAYMDTVPHEKTLVEKLKKMFEKLKRMLADWLKPWYLPTAAGLATTAILVIIFWPQRLEQRINTSYQSLASANQQELTQFVRTFTMPWDNAVMGFKQKDNNSQTLAFGAGLWTGKNELLANATDSLPELLTSPNGKQWKSGQWADFYQLGRCFFLLWVDTKTEPEQTIWTEHAEILQQLTNEFDGDIANSLQAINTKLQSLIASKNPLHEQNQLRRLLETTMQDYAPN